LLKSSLTIFATIISAAAITFKTPVLAKLQPIDWPSGA
jgi:hypothetical protein